MSCGVWTVVAEHGMAMSQVKWVEWPKPKSCELHCDLIDEQ